MGTGGTLTVWSPANLGRLQGIPRIAPGALNRDPSAYAEELFAFHLWSGAWQEGYPTASISFEHVLSKQRTAN